MQWDFRRSSTRSSSSFRRCSRCIAGAITAGSLAPRFLTSSDFSFNPQPDAGIAERQKRDWNSAIAEPSRLQVSDYLIANPGSRFSTAAWEYIDDHPTDPDDQSGASLTSPEAVDYSFSEGLHNGKLIAIATSGFDVNFPRNMIGTTPTSLAIVSDSIVYADRKDDIAAEYASRYEDKGSKLQYDIGLIGAANSLAINTGQILREAPSGTAKLATTFGKSASVKIGDTIFDGPSGKLFAEIRSGGFKQLDGLNSWAGLRYNGDTQPSFNVINRALREALVSNATLTGEDHSLSIDALTQDVRKSSKEILWVSIAVDYTPADLTALQGRLAKADNDSARAAIQIEMENLVTADRRNLANARLRAQDARLQLIQSGIDGKRISMVSEPQNEIGSGVRLRFFGSR